jgi:hypothetical protein
VRNVTNPYFNKQNGGIEPILVNQNYGLLYAQNSVKNIDSKTLDYRFFLNEDPLKLLLKPREN